MAVPDSLVAVAVVAEAQMDCDLGRQLFALRVDQPADHTYHTRDK